MGIFSSVAYFCFFHILFTASIMVLGSLTGSFCGGVQSGRFGRKKSLMIDCFNFVLGTLLVSLAPNFYLILIGRYIHGHSSASAMVAIPIYTSEVSQPQVRKTTGSFTMLCYSSGFALALVLGKAHQASYLAFFYWMFSYFRRCFSMEMGYRVHFDCTNWLLFLANVLS